MAPTSTATRSASARIRWPGAHRLTGRGSVNSGKADPSGEGSTYDWIFLVMVHQRQGRPEEARQWLNKAKAQIADAAEGKVPLQLLDRLMLESLIREAEAVLADDNKA